MGAMMAKGGRFCNSLLSMTVRARNSTGALRSLCCWAVFLAAAGVCFASPPEDALDRALSQAGLKRDGPPREGRSAPPAWQAELELPVVGALLRDPWGADQQERALLDAVLGSARSLGDAVTVASGRLLGAGERGGQGILAYDFSLADVTGSLAGTIAQIHQQAGQPLSPQQRQSLDARCAAVPPRAGQRAALLLFAAREARRRREQVFQRLLPGAAERLWAFRESGTLTREIVADLTAFDLSGMMEAAHLLAAAMDASQALPADRPPKAYAFDWDSPWGRISLHGSGQDTYPAGDYLLIVDEAGDDVYLGGASTSPGAPVSLLLDLAGGDRYPNGPASGSLGYAVLIDAAGNDSYGGSSHGLGDGFFGAGILWDRSGDDVYNLKSRGEGAGEAGLGLLLDGGGADAYDIVREGQGFGSTRGAGVLVDVEGNDRYTADDTQIEFPSAQTPAHNDSMAQGTGAGLRQTDGEARSIPGGAGVLVDGAGDDLYSAGVFAQGAGYFHAAGLLLDASGNDRYRAAWYGQGAAAHDAAGLLLDVNGNDEYRAELNTSMGAGHDGSLGRMDDLQGDDDYSGANLILGAGSEGGAGIFWDHAGSDRYSGQGELLLGAAVFTIPEKKGSESLGLFLDTGARRDRYPPGGQASNGKSWKAIADWSRSAGLDE